MIASNSCSERREGRASGEINEKNSWVNKRRGGKAQSTYCVEVPGPLEGKSLLETHCSLKSPPAAHRQPVCASAYLNIPHPKKNSQIVSVQVGGSGNQREGEREKGRRRKKERFSYSAAVAMETRPDNTYSLCHSGMKDLEWITSPPCQTALPPFISTLLHSPVKWKPDECWSLFKSWKSLVHEWNSGPRIPESWGISRKFCFIYFVIRHNY